MSSQMCSLNRLGDAHCHLSVEINQKSAESLLNSLNVPDLPHRFFHLMSTNHIDIEMIDLLVSHLLQPVIYPYFGIHPWYSHLLTTLDPEEYDEITLKKHHYESILTPIPSEKFLEILPTPINITSHLKKIEKLCETHKIVGIGEIGLDKLFRIPTNGYYGNQQMANDADTKLTNYRVKMEHQSLVFRRQLDLANTLKLRISVHCVKAHGPLYEIIPQYTEIPTVVLHSFSGSIDQAKLWVRNYKHLAQRLAFSFSNYINGTPEKRQHLSEMVSILEPNQVLIETDISIDKHSWSEYCGHLLGIKQSIREIKHWTEEEVDEIMESNFR